MTKTKTKTKTNTLRQHLHRAILETCDLWDIWWEWSRDTTWPKKTMTYSWPSLVWPNTEELISRPFVGENWFRLVLPKRVSTENAVGCLLWLSRSLFFVFHSLPCPLGAQGNFARGFVPKGPIWICHHGNFGFLLDFLSGRIIETNNKGGNVSN